MRIRILVLLLAASSLLAQSALQIDLSGEWRKSADDQPAYAQPDFDDHAWNTVPLTWTSRPPVATYWLRRSIDLPDWADRSQLVLSLGPVSEIYEVYVNGVRIGGVGTFADDEQARIARSQSLPIPAQAVGSDRRLVVAIRARRVDFGQQILSIFAGGSYLLTYSDNAPSEDALHVINAQRLIHSPKLICPCSFSRSPCCLASFGWLAEQGPNHYGWG